MSYIFVKHPQEESEAPKNFSMGKNAEADDSVKAKG